MRGMGTYWIAWIRRGMKTCRESSIRSEFVVAFMGERMLKILVVVVINLETSGSWATELKVVWNC